MEHIICSNIMSHATNQSIFISGKNPYHLSLKVKSSNHNILYTLQHGFRSQRSCKTQMVEFVHDIVSNMAAGSLSH